MEAFKEIPEEKRRTDFRFTLGFTLLAGAVYALTVCPGAFPGESASLITQFTGLAPQSLPLHPLLGGLAGWLARLPLFSLPLRLNLLSVLCTAVSAGMIYRMTSFLIHDAINEEYSMECAPKAAVWAGAVAAGAFAFAAPVWQCATRLQYQSWDMMLVLLCVTALLSYAARKKAIILIVFALLWGMGTAESVIFIPVAPVILSLLVYVLWKDGTLRLSRVTWILLVAVFAWASLYWESAHRFYAAADHDVLPYESTWGVLLAVWKDQIRQLDSGLPRVNWLILLLTSVVPWAAAVLTSFRALNNERSMSQYLLHIAIAVLVVIGLLNAGISPWGLLEPTGRLPIASYVMLSLTAGYLVAYFYLMFKVSRPKRGYTISRLTRQTGDWLGLILTYPLAVLVILCAIVNAFSSSGRRGLYADRCAKEILDRLGGRTWFVTDGTLDDHLLIAAKERKAELNLICLQNDMDTAYLKRFAKLVAAKKLFPDADSRRMQSSLELGILPFIQDWFAMDKDIEKKCAVFGVPDFWFSAGNSGGQMVPVPEFLFFGGSRDINKQFAGKKLLADYMAFWKSMDKTLAPNSKDREDPVSRFRQYLRRHMGFVANNLGIMLEDLGHPDDAFAVYNYIYDTIDPENISVLFNRFELARKNDAPAAAITQRDAIEHELKDFISNLKHTYPLWSLSRYFGYVRSPELFANLGWGWALSGQTGAALAGVNRGIQLLPPSERSGAMQAVAAIYSLAEEKTKTRAVYENILKDNPSNRNALLGLARLSMQEGSVANAQDWLKKAAKADGKPGALGVEWAVIYLMNNDMAKARVALQQATDLQPKDLQAWAMLAMVQLQQNELDNLEKVTLPKMEAIAGTIDNYFVQITRAQLAARKADDAAKELGKVSEQDLKNNDLPAVKKLRGFQRQAREAYIRSSLLRPDVNGLKDMILQLDIAMNDKDSADRHARQVLRANRKHALANYVLGSLRLQEGRYGDAEDFLRRSVDAKPTANALNDLAETLRRIKRYDQAERCARQCLEMNPQLYIAWETLGSILLEENKNLDEAEKAILKSIELYDGDLRTKITLARVLVKKGEIERARQIIHQIKSRQSELSPYDQDELGKLSDQVKRQ
jgi:Flp pilus assembly protein TadD